MRSKYFWLSDRSVFKIGHVETLARVSCQPPCPPLPGAAWAEAMQMPFQDFPDFDEIRFKEARKACGCFGGFMGTPWTSISILMVEVLIDVDGLRHQLCR